MTDTITESFCERCGTRYSFEQNAEHRRGRIGRVRVLTRGLKNYVANDGMPMSEALAEAQHDEARMGVSRQLDAFHRTFNFCMSCRQYTCANCWNAKVGECLTCAPDLSREVLPAPFPDLPLGGPVHGDGQAPGNGALEPEAWPTADLARLTIVGAAAAGPEVGATAETEAIAPPEAVALPEAAPDGELTAAELAAIESALAAGHPVDMPAAELDVAAEARPGPPVVEAAETPVAAPTPEPTLVTAAEPDLEPAAIEVAAAVPLVAAVEPEPGAQPAPVQPEPAAAQPTEPAERATAAQQQTRNLLRRFRPAHRPAAAGLDAAAAAAAATAATEATTDIAAVTAEPATQPGSVTPPVPEPTAVPVVAPALADAIEQPTWRVVAPEAPVTPPASWPDAPAWPTAEPGSASAGPLPGSPVAPWASRLATARPEPTSVWAASSQEVLAGPGPSAATRPGTPAVQACVSCGLSLSANARFCRRCGSRQA